MEGTRYILSMHELMNRPTPEIRECKDVSTVLSQTEVSRCKRQPPIDSCVCLWTDKKGKSSKINCPRHGSALWIFPDKKKKKKMKRKGEKSDKSIHCWLTPALTEVTWMYIRNGAKI